MYIFQNIYFTFIFQIFKIFIKIILKLQEIWRIRIVQRTLILFIQACLLLAFCPICFSFLSHSPSISFTVSFMGCVCVYGCIFLEKFTAIRESCPLTNEHLHIHFIINKYTILLHNQKEVITQQILKWSNILSGLLSLLIKKKKPCSLLLFTLEYRI